MRRVGTIDDIIRSEPDPELVNAIADKLLPAIRKEMDAAIAAVTQTPAEPVAAPRSSVREALRRVGD